MLSEAPQPAANPSQYDELPPALERALFRKFWTWLVIVSSVIFAVGSGLSVVASQLIASVVDERVRVANGRIDNLADHSLRSIDRIQERAIDAAIKTAAEQSRTSANAAAAQAAAASLDERLRSYQNVEKILKDTDSIVGGLASNKEFSDRVTTALDARMSKQVDVYKCPAGWTSEDKHGRVAWLSTGCQGQLSVEPKCGNRSWNLDGRGAIDEDRPCDRVGRLHLFDPGTN